MQVLSNNSENDIYPTIQSKYVLLFCGYVFFWYVDLVSRIPFLASIRFEFIYAGFLSLIIVTALPGNSIPFPLKKIVALLFLVTAIQVPLSHDFLISEKIFVDRFVKFSFMAWFISAFIRSPRDMRWFLAAFLFACMKLGQEGLFGQISGSLVWENQGVMRLHGSVDKYGHPNSFSGMALGTVPFILCLFPVVQKKFKLVLMVALIFAANIVLFTGSRTGYAAFVILLIFYVLKSKYRLKILVATIVICAISIHYIPEQYKGRFNSIFTGKDKEGHSTEMRIEILRDAVAILFEYPLGVGVGAFPSVRRAKFNRIQDTHNLYLEVATNLGFQGFIVFMIFVISMLRLLNRIEKRFNRCIDTLKEFELKNMLYRSEVVLLKDSEFLEATAKSIFLFICVRLGLGLFGMDLYEIYWWFALGVGGALFRICHYVEIEVEKIKENKEVFCE